MSKDTLADNIVKFAVKGLMVVYNKVIVILSRKGMIGEGAYALDSTDIITPKGFPGAGCVKRKKKIKNPRKGGKKIEIEEELFGFKLFSVYEVRSRIVVSILIVPIQEADCKYLLKLVGQARENVGKEKMKVLVVDRGFIDGKSLYKIKHELGIDFIIPGKTTMHVVNDARGLRKFVEREGKIQKADSLWEKGKKEGGYGIKGIMSYEQFNDDESLKKPRGKSYNGGLINAVVVTMWKSISIKPGEEVVFLTTLQVDDIFKIIKCYRLRSLIENTEHRELKQGLALKCFPKRTENAAHVHIILTVLVFSLTNAYRTKKGQNITTQGIRRWRRSNRDLLRKLLIIADNCYGFFEVEEFAALVGAPPEYALFVDMRACKKKYGL